MMDHNDDGVGELPMSKSFSNRHLEVIDESETENSVDDDTVGLWLTADDKAAAVSEFRAEAGVDGTNALTRISSYNNHQLPESVESGDDSSDSSQSNPDDTSYEVGWFFSAAGKRRYRSTLFSTVMVGLVVFGLLMISSSWSSLQTSNEEVSQLVSIREQSGQQVSTFEESIRKLMTDLSATDAFRLLEDDKTFDVNSILDDDAISKTEDGASSEDDKSSVADPQMVEEVSNLQDKVKELSQKADSLKEHVQELSKLEAIQKYGSGVHRVKIELAFPDQLDGPDYFVIELAPMELMPHSVHFFLEMVSTGLLNGCSFILNALHVLKVAPLPYDGSSAAEKARAFTKHGLESVAFKEYSEKFPHKQYTVGFAADGSPSFYINTEDNDEIHIGDPCFGRIVEGLDAVKRLENCPTKNGIWFEQRIGIKRAVLLSENYLVGQTKTNHYKHDES